MRMYVLTGFHCVHLKFIVLSQGSPSAFLPCKEEGGESHETHYIFIIIRAVNHFL